MERLTVPLSKLEPNTWNPNKMNERQYQAELESISQYGFIDPITVRAVDDHYEIIDGEHRWKAAQELSLEEVPVVVLALNDADAKKLTVILNETRGKADTVDLSRLLADLNAELDPEALMRGLPYTEAELSDMLELAEFDWESFSKDGEDSGESEDFTTVTAAMPQSAYEVFKEAYDKVVARLEEDGLTLHSRATVATGQVLEALAAEFLAG